MTVNQAIIRNVAFMKVKKTDLVVIYILCGAHDDYLSLIHYEK